MADDEIPGDRQDLRMRLERADDGSKAGSVGENTHHPVEGETRDQSGDDSARQSSVVGATSGAAGSAVPAVDKSDRQRDHREGEHRIGMVGPTLSLDEIRNRKAK